MNCNNNKFNNKLKLNKQKWNKKKDRILEIMKLKFLLLKFKQRLGMIGMMVSENQMMLTLKQNLQKR
jgi:hypothetical protein